MAFISLCGWVGGWGWCVGRCQKADWKDCFPLLLSGRFFVPGPDWFVLPTPASSTGVFSGVMRFPARVRAKDLTYHHVMEEELPGLAQLLVQEHVEEVVDEVTCGEEAHQPQVTATAWKRDTFLWQQRSKCVKWTPLPWRPRPRCILAALFISAHPTPRLPGVSMVTAIQNVGGKNKEALRIEKGVLEFQGGVRTHYGGKSDSLVKRFHSSLCKLMYVGIWLV